MFAVRYNNRFVVFGDEGNANRLSKAINVEKPTRVMEVKDVVNIPFNRIVGKIGQFWYIKEG